MAVPPALLEQLLRLDDRERVEVAEMLLSTVEDGEDDDDLDEAETARLHTALEQSLDDIEAGRVHDAAAVLEEVSSAAGSAREITGAGGPDSGAAGSSRSSSASQR